MRAHTAGLEKEIGIILPACPDSDKQLTMLHWTSLSWLGKKSVSTNSSLLFGHTSLNLFFALGKLETWSLSLLFIFSWQTTCLSLCPSCKWQWKVTCTCLRAGKSSCPVNLREKNSSYIKLEFIVLYCSYLQVLILIVSLDLESLRKLIQEDRLVKVKHFKAIYNTFLNLE